MQRRLQELKRELEIGLERLAELERSRTDLRDKLLRISGAIQVLEELTTSAAEPTEKAA
jgi:hypothetical protein